MFFLHLKPTTNIFGLLQRSNQDRTTLAGWTILEAEDAPGSQSKSHSTIK